MSGDRTNDFWEFSLRVYRRPGVAAACLRLQDSYGADVNLALFFCWLASRRSRPLGAGEIAAVVEETADWRDSVVRPLRAVRRRMKRAFRAIPPMVPESLRSEIKRVELESERLQQAALFDRVAGEMTVAVDPETGAGNARENLRRYFNQISPGSEEMLRIDCETVVAAAFGPN